MDDRYQHQPWWVKLWRRRYYLMIPFMALRLRWFGEMDGHNWDVAIGLAQVDMKWYYESHEIWDEDMSIGTDNKLADSSSNKSSDSRVVDV